MLWSNCSLLSCSVTVGFTKLLTNCFRSSFEIPVDQQCCCSFRNVFFRPLISPSAYNPPPPPFISPPKTPYELCIGPGLISGSLRYELYDLRKRIDLNYVALGVVLACKNEGRTLELEEKEKWCVDEVKRLKVIVVTVVGTKTRLSAVEYRQWRSLRGRDYLSKQRMNRQVRGSLVIVSEISLRETLRLFTRLVTERDMLHDKDYIGNITKAREDGDSMVY